MSDLPKAKICRSTTYQAINRCDQPEGHEGVHKNEAQGGWWEQGAKNACEAPIEELRASAQTPPSAQIRCPGCRSRREGACPGCKTAKVEESSIVWRQSVGDFVTDILHDLGEGSARLIANEIINRLGGAVTTAQDREAAIGWAYGKPSSEMSDEVRSFVRTGAMGTTVPEPIDRMSKVFAEVRTGIRKGKE